VRPTRRCFSSATTLDWRCRLAPAAIANGARWLVADHDKPNDPVRFARNSFSFLNSL
jgi:hypothetical protein